MAKKNIKVWNDFCPQALYLYGTKKEDGSANFGLFCWFTFNWRKTEDPAGGLGVMCCIGDEKLTKDLIRKNGVFSANLVSEALLPLADYYGNIDGRTEKDKMKYVPTIEPGQTLDVPTIAESPVTLELHVDQTIEMTDGSTVFFCEIAGVTLDEALLEKDKPFIERYLHAAPVLCGGEDRYVSADGRDLGAWGEPMKKL